MLKNLFYLPFISIVIGFGLVMSPIEAQSVSPSQQAQTTFTPATERFLRDNSISEIVKMVKHWHVQNEDLYWPLFEQIIKEEKEGFFGYNGGNREFRIYQDVIRFAIEEILNIPLRPDFYFLRVPGDPLQSVNSAAEFLEKNRNKVNNGQPLQAQQLLSVNTALYGGWQNNDECSSYYFMVGRIVINQDFEKRLVPFFTKLGIDPSHIHQAFEIARNMLSKKGGYLLQFFDYSDYELADAQSYLAIWGGGQPYYPIRPVSELMLNPAEQEFPQLRLILNNKHTLNPYSSLSMKRYDLTSPEATKAYEQAMRDYFQTLSVNVNQKEVYKNELLNIWSSIN